MRFANEISGATYLSAVNKIHAYGREMAAVFDDFDVILSATLAEPPAQVGRFSHDREDYENYRIGPGGVFEYSPFCAAFNASGQPAASVPMHWTEDGLPIGIQLAAAFGEDADLIALCAELERAAPWAHRRPALLADYLAIPRNPLQLNAKGDTRLSTDIAVDARNVGKIYGSGKGEVQALADVSISIEKGEFFTLLGPSGCGKTTLLRCIAGFETPTSGTIHLSGKDITHTPPNQRPVNTVFQSYALFPHLTVAQNVGFGLKMQGKPAAEVARAVERVLALVKLEEFADRLPQQLSGGQQQRVALARALAPEPEVLLLDEPLSALDLKLRKEMQSELKRLQTETGITFIFVTHDQEEALTMSNRIGVMSRGELLQVGTPHDIYDRPVNRFVADFIGETNFLEARVDGTEVRIGTGDILNVPLNGQEGTVTLALRPEQIRLMPHWHRHCSQDRRGDLSGHRHPLYLGPERQQPDHRPRTIQLGRNVRSRRRRGAADRRSRPFKC